MGDASAELQLVEEAFGRPTLDLLRGTWAPVRVAILKIVFDQDRRSIPTEQLHARVGALVGSLRASGKEMPTGSGRDLCRKWMRSRWLTRFVIDGVEVYELTSSALEALEVVQGLSSDRQLLSESRLAAIVDAVRRQAIEASPDAQPRIDRLNAQIERLTAERDRLIAGEIPELASDDRMIEGYHNLIDLIGQLPSDFKRVEEEMRALRDTILADLRDENRPLGDVIDEYLVRTDRLLDTPEGRAFEGALGLLRDEAMLVQLSTDLDVVLAHPFTAVLSEDEVRAFRGTVTMVQRGIDDVLGQRRRANHTLADRIRSHDAVRERELAAALVALRGELTMWVRTGRVHSRVDVELLPSRVGTLPHVRERFYDPEDHVAPAPLGPDEDADDPGLSLQEILRQGGPLLTRVRAELVASASGDARSLAEAFELFPDDLRRPVEILGINHLLSLVGGFGADDDLDPVDTIRPDGTTRQLLLPRVPVTSDLSAGLSEVELG